MRARPLKDVVIALLSRQTNGATDWGKPIREAHGRDENASGCNLGRSFPRLRFRLSWRSLPLSAPTLKSAYRASPFPAAILKMEMTCEAPHSAPLSKSPSAGNRSGCISKAFPRQWRAREERPLRRDNAKLRPLHRCREPARRSTRPILGRDRERHRRAADATAARRTGTSVLDRRSKSATVFSGGRAKRTKGYLNV